MPGVALSSHGQQLIGDDAALGRVRAFMIVVPHPASRLIVHFIDRIEPLLRQPVSTKGSVEAFVISVLLRLYELNVFDSDAVPTCPGLHRSADIRWPVIAPDGPRHLSSAGDQLQRPED